MKALLVAVVLACSISMGAAQSSSARLPIEKVLRETVIDEVKLDKASLDLWVAFLRSKVETSPGVPLNVVIPPAVRERVGEQTVTLDLRKVPAEAVLKYCIQLNSITYKIESRAVVLIP